MNYEAVIFDVDGTLVTTEAEYRQDVVKKTLDALRVPFSKEKVDQFWFAGDRDTTIEKCFSVDPELFWRTFNTYRSAETRKRFTRVYHDIDFIDTIKTNGFQLGIVTNAPPDVAEANFDLLPFHHFDAAIIAYGELVKAKPDPEGLHKCLEILGVSNDEAIYVGNSDEDIYAARNAGVLDVLIDRGEFEFPDLKPSLRIENLYELRDLLGI